MIGRENKARWFLCLAPLVVFAAAGFWLLPDYGFFGDERLETPMIWDNFRLIGDYWRGDFADPYGKILGNLGYYGTFFNLAALLFQYPFIQTYGLLSAQSLLAKQYAVFAFSLMAYAGIGAALYRLTRSNYSTIIAIITLGMEPLFFSHAFFDSKDIPFAALFTLSSLSAGYVVSEIRAFRVSSTRAYGLSALQGLIIGLCASVRIGGVIALLFFYAILFAENRRNPVKPVALCAGVTFAVMFTAIWILQPVSYTAPLRWMWESLAYHNHHPFDTATLTDGEWIRSFDMRWYYLPKWLLAQTPLVMDFLALAGMIAFARGMRRQSSLMNATGSAFFLQLTAAPVYAVISHMHLYDGMRHFLFICPAVAFFAGLGIFTLLKSRLGLCALVIAACAAGKLAYEMVELHPYENAYFIEPLRAPDMEKRWWTAPGNKEMIGWLNAHTPDDRPTEVFGPYARGSVFERYAKAPLHLHNMADLSGGNARRPYYMIMSNAYNTHPFSLDACILAYAVRRKLGNVTLDISSVWRCDIANK